MTMTLERDVLDTGVEEHPQNPQATGLGRPASVVEDSGGRVGRVQAAGAAPRPQREDIARALAMELPSEVEDVDVRRPLTPAERLAASRGLADARAELRRVTKSKSIRRRGTAA